MPNGDTPNSANGQGPPENSVLHWMYELNATDDEGEAVYSDADLEAIVDTPAGDKSVTPAKRAAARWWMIMSAKGTDDNDALRSIAKWNDRQFGKPRQSVMVDATTVHVKRIILDDRRQQRQDPPPEVLPATPGLAGLLSDAAVVVTRTTAPEQLSPDNDPGVPPR